MAPSTASAKAPTPELPPLPLPSLAGTPVAEVLRLIRTPNVGPHTFFQLVERFGSVAEALHRLPDLAARGGNKRFTPCTVTDAGEEQAQAGKFGARLLRYGEADYPAWLHHIPDPPPLLYALGNPALWQERLCLGIVGARNASAGGCSFAQKLGKELSEAGIAVVSGLARGIDTFAHRGAVAQGTVAVVAGGIDNIYPPENEKLHAEIRDKGAILSEQPFGAAPFAGSFPGRNRIISGMSRGIIVVEASFKSGSLITARFAAEQGREVYAVPGFPLDPRASGCNALIKQGATLVENASDILENLPGNAPISSPQLSLLETPASVFGTQEENAPATPLGEEDARRSILEKLGKTPVLVDEIQMQCQLTSGLLFTVLMELELAGRIQRLPGNRICLRF